MSDITFMKGYGFPRGGRMDYAGYRGFGGVLVNNPPRRQLSAVERIPMAPEPSIFAKIPALDGMDDYGSEYTFEEDVIEPGPMYGPEYRPELLNPPTSGWKWGLGLLAAAWFLTRG